MNNGGILTRKLGKTFFQPKNDNSCTNRKPWSRFEFQKNSKDRVKIYVFLKEIVKSHVFSARKKMNGILNGF